MALSREFDAQTPMSSILTSVAWKGQGLPNQPLTALVFISWALAVVASSFFYPLSWSIVRSSG
jgi:hypothetical protein